MATFGNTSMETDRTLPSYQEQVGTKISDPSSLASSSKPLVGNGGGINSENSSSRRPTWKERLSNLCSRRFLTILLLGQLLSLCITATTIFTTKLAQGDNPVSIPTTQSFLNYFVLGLVYTAITIYKEGFRGWINIMRRRAFYYMLFAVIDVEGNYFVVKAYNYTSLLSAMLLDAWTIPCVVLLSVFFLKMRFIRYHYLGVFLAMVGMGFLIWSDMVAGKDFPGSDYVKGDLFCLLGATLYAVSNVYQEFLVRQTPMYEVVGQLGFWATILNGIQLAILERHEIRNVDWTPEVIGYMVGFDIALFIMYSLSPVLFRLSSATFFNLSLLTSDFYGLLFGLFLFNAKINKLYPIAYVLIIGGILVYNIYPAPEPMFEKVLQRDNRDSKVQSDQDQDETIV
ncbi:solute carrier family 35, member F1/2 [Entomortierella parvispora]|uniref:Solute carrier family 35, member F1/2 n=1 Tax=Entomortierella parvispora TaxID=205924 RepID=A0A9P3H4C2_9FUNG|nr:solute carrier family 35, member F1/2 [Entomortierella parvispora]